MSIIKRVLNTYTLIFIKGIKVFGFNLEKLFLLCILVIAPGCTSFETLFTEKSIDRARNSFVKVFVDNNYDAFLCFGDEISLDECDEIGEVHSESMTGSGFSIKNTEIGTVAMTAGHLCESINNATIIDSPMTISVRNSIYVQDKDGNHFDAIILKIDSEEDLCSILIQDANIPAARISSTDPSIGEKLYNLSAPRGIFSPNNIMIFEGMYTGQFPNGWSGYTIPAAPGSSGSAVINRRGEVVGMIDAVVIGFNQISLGPTRQSIISFLE